MANNSSHSLVKSRALHYRVRFVEQFIIQNIALTSDGFGSDKIITSNHSHSDASLVALSDSNRDFGSDNILDTNNSNESEAALLNIIKVVSISNAIVIWATLIRLKVSVSERDCS